MEQVIRTLHLTAGHLQYMQEALFERKTKIAEHLLRADAFAHVYHAPVPFDGQEVGSVRRAYRAHGIQQVGGVEQEAARAATATDIDAALIPISAIVVAACK